MRRTPSKQSNVALKNNIPRVIRAVNEGVKKAALRLGYRMDAEIKDRMSLPGQGIIYGDHQASAPGDPPAVDTGTLRASVVVREINNGVIVSTNMEYAVYLEFGTIKMAPRPVWIPVYNDVMQEADSIVNEEVKSHLRNEGNL